MTDKQFDIALMDLNCIYSFKKPFSIDYEYCKNEYDLDPIYVQLFRTLSLSLDESTYNRSINYYQLKEFIISQFKERYITDICGDCTSKRKDVIRREIIKVIKRVYAKEAIRIGTLTLTEFGKKLRS